MRIEDVLQIAKRLLSQGMALYRQGHLDAAQEHNGQALMLLLSTVSSLGESTPPEVWLLVASSLHRVGLVHQARGAPQQALEYYLQALEIVEQIAPTTPKHADLLHSTGEIYEAQGNFRKALQYYQRALTIDQAIAPESLTTAADLSNIGYLYLAMRNLKQALECFQRSLAILERVAPDSQEQITCLLHIGGIYRAQWELGKSLQYFQQALAIVERVAPNSIQHAACSNEIGNVCYLRGDSKQALTHLHKALAIAESVAPNSQEHASYLINTGFVYRMQGDLKRANEYLLRALTIVERVAPNSQPHAACLTNIGGMYREQGDLAQALKHFQQALGIVERVAPNSELHAACLTDIGGVYREQGDLAQALKHFQQALEMDLAIAHSSLATATDLLNIGGVYQEQGLLSRALDYFQRALIIVEQVAPNSQEHAACLNNIAGVYESQGNLGRALDYYQRALAIDQAIGQSSSQTARDLNNIAHVYQEQGDLERALRHYQQALEIQLSIYPYSPKTAINLNNIGLVYARWEHTAQALHYFQQALTLLQKTSPESPETAVCHTNIGRMRRMQGDLAQAVPHLVQAVEVAESLRTRAGSLRAREQLFEQHQSPYQALIACLYERNQPNDHARAFHYAERSRARTLLELLAERQVDIHPETEVQQRLLEQERALQFRLAATHNRLVELRQNPQTPPEVLQQGESEERELEEQLEWVRSAIRREFPAYAHLEYPEPLTLEEVQQRVLDPNALLLEYDTTGEETFVWAVRQERFQMIPLPVTGEQLSSLVAGAVIRHHGADLPEQVEQVTRAQLGEVLIGVVPEAFWEGVSRVIVVPDGALYYLPFEMLPLPDGRLLGEAYPVVYAPSATVLHNLRQLWDRRPAPPYQGEFVGFGDPLFGGEEEGTDEQRAAASRFAQRGLRLARLPGTRVEVEGIAQRFAGRSAVYLHEEATEHRAKTATGGYRYVHFATHGLLDDRNPLYSGLALSPPQPTEPPDADDLLQVWEMFGLKLDAEVVTLSACQTGLGTVRGGEGLVGMSRALFFAGAKCLVVSLWSVPDVQTAQLMQWFYEELVGGKSVVEALRAAKARMRAVEPDPYYWAAFVPIGLAW